LNEVAMMAINKQLGRHKIEELLPWHATGTLSRCDADRVEQALAGNRELAQRYELELAGTVLLNETLGAPSARAMEKLFAAISACSRSKAPCAERSRWRWRKGRSRISPADIAVSVTGVAGPDPDEDGNPVGRVCMAVAHLGLAPSLSFDIAQWSME
jgi:Competence-damaged protein